MARKPSPVTLAGRAAARDKVGRGHEDATPERLRQARRHGAAKVDGAGIRRLADPFDVLHARNLLDRSDVVVNETLWHAGNRLRAHWHGALFDGISAFDFSRPVVDKGAGGAPGSLNPSETTMRHRENFRRAKDAVGARLMPYVKGVVIDEEPAARLTRLVGDTSHPRTAEALALERLREGLHRLVELWSMRTRTRQLPITGWRSEDKP